MKSSDSLGKASTSVREFVSAINWRITAALMAVPFASEMLDSFFGKHASFIDLGDFVEFGLELLAFGGAGIVISQQISKHRQSEERFMDLYENAPHAYFTISSDGKILRANRTAEKLLGYSKDELEKMKMADLYADTPDGLAKAVNTFEQFKLGKEIGNKELQMRKNDDTVIWVSLTANQVLDSKGNIKESRSMVEDITKRKSLETEIKKLSDVVGQITESVIITDREGVIQYVNSSFTKLTEYTPDEAIGNTPRILKSGSQDQEFYESMWNTILRGEVFNGILYNKKQDGGYYWSHNIITPVMVDGEIQSFITTSRDITELLDTQEQLTQKAAFVDRNPGPVLQIGKKGDIRDFNVAAEKIFGGGLKGVSVYNVLTSLDQDYLKYLSAGTTTCDVTVDNKAYSFVLVGDPEQERVNAYGLDITEIMKLARYDALTGLANRRHFLEQAGILFENAKRYKHPSTLVYVDLDGFKQINDSYGHAAGDILLKAFAEGCTAVVREADLIGRLGGDEFIMYLAETDGERAVAFINRLDDYFSQKEITISEGVTRKIQMSKGVITFGPTSESLDALVTLADETMYSAKQTEKGSAKYADYVAPLV